MWTMFSLYEVLVIFSSILAVACVKKLTSDSNPAILNVYKQRGNFFWLKTAFMYVVLSLRKLKPNKIDYNELEKPQELFKHPKAVDAVYFNGANAKGNFLITGTARRPNNLIDGFFYIKLDNYGLLQSPKLPYTNLVSTLENKYEADGILIEPVEPMRKWRISYDGDMKDEEGRLRKVEVNMEWVSDLPAFNFDSDMDPLLMAKAMAKEDWSNDYFSTVKFFHQTHYEQHGDMRGTVTVDGKSQILSLNAMRDHTVGKVREWRNLHRYGLHFLTVANGDRICVGMISMPIVFSCLHIGYIFSAKDGKMYPVQDCDLNLYQYGEDGSPPDDYAFAFKAGGENYVVEVEVIKSPEFYISKDCESKIVERMSKFKVNGRSGWGTAEWQYRNFK